VAAERQQHQNAETALKRPTKARVRVGVYARVSTADQDTVTQLEALRQYAAARDWEAVEFVDHGVSGAKERRPALDALLSAARRRELLCLSRATFLSVRFYSNSSNQLANT